MQRDAAFVRLCIEWQERNQLWIVLGLGRKKSVTHYKKS